MISIVTPVYNAATFIRQTMEMVQAQTYTDWELLLVDDGSKDNSVDVIEAFLKEKPDERIRLINKAINEGAALTRNRGIKEAKGRYIAFLDKIYKRLIEEKKKILIRKDKSFTILVLIVLKTLYMKNKKNEEFL